MANQREKRNIKLDALYEQWPVVCICRRKVPQPGHNAQALEALVSNVMIQLLHRGDGVMEVDRCETENAVWERPGVFSNLLVGGDDRARPISGRKAYLRHAGLIHQGYDLPWG